MECGANLLSLTARGSSIIAELLRLSDHIPPVFLPSDNNNSSDPSSSSSYSNLLFDFDYLKSPEIYDEKIDQDAELIELDEEFRETHFALLERFYALFDSIYKYQADLHTFLEDLNDGVYVQHSMESILLDGEGKQLMCESLYLYGVMLLLMDRRIPGLTRERMIVSYSRYKLGSAAVNNFDNVAKLCHSTGYLPHPKARPVPGYPENFFARFPFSKFFVEMVIGRLRSDDIYNRNQAFPSPDHRSTALATQAAMLYVILYFAPHILHKKQAIMREIVDKHFNDNWCLAFYMGFTVDLSDKWASYKAAQLALNNIVERTNVNEILETHVEHVSELTNELDRVLVEGVLVEEYVLNNIRPLIRLVRNCNVTLRWHLLHRNTVHRKFGEQIRSALSAERLLVLLMNSAQFEFLLKEIFRKLLDEKQQRWEANKTEAAGRMRELSSYFSGEMALTRVEKNERLQGWFNNLAEEIGKLEYHNSTQAGRTIARLMAALEEVEDFHQIEESLQVKTFLADTRTYLTKMIRTVNVKPSILGDLDIICDFSFASRLIDSYTNIIHQKIRGDPNIVLRLRATFLKLSSILSLPLVRITECESQDAVSVAEYYSSSLVAYVRKVLDIIPVSVFALLDSITQLKTHRLKALPSKLERIHIKDVAQLPERYELAQLTHQVSVFTEGILAMKTTLVGIIKLDPKALLEDGIRKQLVHQVCVAMDDLLVFKSGAPRDFEKAISTLGRRLDGYRQSFEYIQDYIGVYGLKIWQEELSRIMNYYVEQECNEFLKRKIYDWQSTYQSDAIPIPRFPRTPFKNNNQHLSVNFMGRVVREILNQSNPVSTVYVESQQGWYNAQGRELVGIRTFDLLNRGIGVFGLTGVDKLLCFMIVRDLQRFIRTYRQQVTPKVKQFVHNFATELHPTDTFPQHPQRLYNTGIQQTSKLWPAFLGLVAKIGQAQLIRRQITNELNFSCKLDSKLLYCSLDALNQALLNDVKAHYAKPSSKPYPGNPVLPELVKFLDNAGIKDPITKIYITSEPLEGLPVLMFLLVLSETAKLQWSHELNTLVCQANVALDGAPFVVGVVSILKQFHSSHTSRFLAYIGQYVRSIISADTSGGKAAATHFPQHVVTILHFLEEFCRFSSMSRAVVEQYVPSYVFDRFN